MKLSLGADASVAGYRSDGTSDVEIVLTLHNSGNLRLDDPVNLVVTCGRDGEVIDDCGRDLSISLPDGYGPETRTLTVRSPTGKMSFEIDYGKENTEVLSLVVPERIVGVDRLVWECFRDTPGGDMFWEEDEGGGCAAWASETVRKWDQTSPVKVWLNGPDGFTAEFRDIFADLSSKMNLQVEWVAARPDADVAAYVGLTVDELSTQGVYCDGVDALGCANTMYNVWTGEILGGEIVVYNLWPDVASDLGHFNERDRNRFRSAMIHEAVHMLSDMRHRTELLSIMNSEVHHRAELTPMDEALLRLHGHELVRPGMTMADIGRLIVFNDELLDPHPGDHRLRARTLVSGAYEALREATSARFSVRSSLPDCSEEFGWAEYEVGNLTGRHPYFGWVRVDDGENHFYGIRPSSDESEFWRQTQSGWQMVSANGLSVELPGWRGKLSDPHHMLEIILYYGDWTTADVSIDSGGRTTLRFDLDMAGATGHSRAESVEIVAVIDEGTRTLHEYSMDWNLSGASCRTYRIEAVDGEFDIDFAFPERVRAGSNLVDDCEASLLGPLSGDIQRSGKWARECGPDHDGNGYSRPYRFSLDSWAFVRFELSSADDMYISLLSGDGSGDYSAVDMSASGSIIRRHRPPEKRKFHWAHVPLAPGSYTVEAVTSERVLPGSFTLSVAAQPTPPPPYRFKSVSAGELRTCGLLTDGTPLCWGISSVAGDGAETPVGRFASISTGRHTCAVREDGTPVCWDFRDEGKHTCTRRDDGSTYCKLNEQRPPSSGSGGRDGGGSALASVTIGVIAGYFDQTPPAGERLVSISTGASHACGLRKDGTPVCWGSNQFGKASPPKGERFVAIDVGISHSCGLREDGTAVCWGSAGGDSICWNPQGCSDDEFFRRLSVPEDERFVAITVGNEHTCGLSRDGSITCWGDGTLVLCSPVAGGQQCRIYGGGEDFLLSPPEDEQFSSIGSSEPLCALTTDGTPVCWPREQSGLVPPPEGQRFTSISSSFRHACALRQDGTAACWGEDEYGQSSPPLGVNLNHSRVAEAPSGLASISAGDYHTCALDSDGAAVCWGLHWWTDRFGDRYSSINSSRSHTCAVRLDGTAECHGNDRLGQSSPPPGELFLSVTGGFLHSCGLRSDGTAACWGSSFAGESSPPADEVFTSISSGWAHVCGLRMDGTTVCWGANYAGQLWSPDNEIFESISSGWAHVCGLRLDGTAVCWGDDQAGQSSPPTNETFASISCGGNHVCGLRLDGTAVCWGSNFDGQASPPPDERFVSVSSAETHTCGLREDGTAVCWGNNYFGQASPRR